MLAAGDAGAGWEGGHCQHIRLGPLTGSREQGGQEGKGGSGREDGAPLCARRCAGPR